MKIKALQAFTMRDAETGDLTSVACGAVEEVTDALGSQLISDGLAEAYTLISPTGTKTINENGTGIDVAQYATADVNVAGYEDIALPLIDGVTLFPEVLEIPDGISEVRQYFSQYLTNNVKPVHKIIIPSSVSIIRQYAFEGFTNVTEISLAEGLTTIEYQGLWHFQNLTELTLPSTVTNLAGMFLGKNSGTFDLTVLATTPPTVDGSFSAYLYNAVYVPAESVDAYKSATGWSALAEKIQAIPTA